VRERMEATAHGQTNNACFSAKILDLSKWLSQSFERR